MDHQQDNLTRDSAAREAQGRRGIPSGSRDSRQIERDIDRTRGAMDETLEELGERLNPRKLFDDVLDYLRSSGAKDSAKDTAKRAGEAAGDFATNLGRQVRDNPLGVTLIGAGLAFLAFGGRSDEPKSDEYKFDDSEAMRRRRRLQREDILGADVYDDEEDRFYAEEDLLLSAQYDFDGDDFDEGHERLVLPEDYRDDDETSSGRMDGAKRKAASAATATGDAAGSAWDSTKSKASTATETISDAASAVAGGAKTAASSVGSAASKAGSATSEASRRAYSRSRAAARGAARGTRRAGRRARQGVSSATHYTGEQLSYAYDATAQRLKVAHDEAPLALGLGVLALGAIAGALIPRTRREDEWMGEASDEVLRQVRQEAEQAYEHGREAVGNTMETAKESAKAHGLTSDSLAERAARVVETAAGSISDAAKKEGVHPEQLKEDVKAVAVDAKQQATAEGDDAANSVKAEKSMKSEAGEKKIVDPDTRKAIEK